MKNTTVLECVKRLENELDAEQRAKYDFLNKHIKSGDLCAADLKNGDSVAAALAYLNTLILNEIAADAAKSSGKTAVKKTLENVCKTARASSSTASRFAKAAYLNGCQVVCDGFRLFRLNNAVELSPEFMNGGNGGADAFAAIVEKVLPQAVKNTDLLTVPDGAELDAFIKDGKAAQKLHKDKTPVLWDFGDGKPAVNAEYLRDVLTVYGSGVELYAAGYYGMIYIKSDAGDGVLCPVKKPAYMKTA